MSKINSFFKCINKFIILARSRSLLFSITCDENFDELNKQDFEKYFTKRYSLIRISLGIKIYFISIKIEPQESKKTFHFIKILKLSDSISNQTDASTEKANIYYDSLGNKQKRDIECESDFIKYRINQEQKRKETAANKVYIFLFFLLVLLPMGLTSLKYFQNSIHFYFSISIIIFIIYMYLNALFLIIEYFLVKGYPRSKFYDLKTSDKHFYELIKSYYYDWQNIKKEADNEVSYVINIQNYSIKLFIFTVLYAVYVIIFKLY